MKPVEKEYFRALFLQTALQNIKKQYLEKIAATRFQNVGKPYKTNGKRGSSKCKNAFQNPL